MSVNDFETWFLILEEQLLQIVTSTNKDDVPYC